MQYMVILRRIAMGMVVTIAVACLLVGMALAEDKGAPIAPPPSGRDHRVRQERRPLPDRVHRRPVEASVGGCPTHRD